jgi:UDP-N-acetylglucosamine 2-epimerase
MKHKVLTVIGTRPEIIKMSAVIPLLDAAFDHRLVHSGQHYSADMDEVFFRELELRAPDHRLEVGSAPPAAQLGRIAERFEAVFLQERPHAVVVQGDTNTTLAGALVAAKYRHTGVKLVHVEAGTRSGLSHQPEEINRQLVDRMSDLLLAPYESDREALAAEGISGDHVVVTGSTVFDACLRMSELVDGADVIGAYGLKPGGYVLATFHRQETVDDPKTLSGIVEALHSAADRVPIFLPLHPRTRKRLQENGQSLAHANLQVGEPLGYRDFIGVLKNALFCITDSGGIQEEAALLRVPAIITRENTEHRRYVEAGMHELVGLEPERIVDAVRALMDDDKLSARRDVTVSFDVGIGERVAHEIEKYLQHVPVRGAY